MSDPKDYKDTLQLPNTSFPMKANLRDLEPAILEKWQKEGTYKQMLEASAKRGGKPFIFHDGPPYANGHIHHGHILNKVLKDIVLKIKTMEGYPTLFRPGWDCHGLPIEHAVEKEIGREAARSDPSGLRKKCRTFATKWVESQRVEFERLGVFGTWDNPYLTMTHDYEALTLREFGKFVGSGAVYQGHKPVLWCHVCETALADAEVEYKDAASPSIYVKFPFRDSVGEKVPQLAGRSGGVVIWTTTPWTLPSNLAIAFDPAATYVAVEMDGEALVVAADLQEAFFNAIGRPELGDAEPIASFLGETLENAACKHPFLDRDSLLIVGDHVTMDAGTGCVHTAPGFGEDDFIVGAKYGLEAYAPVNAQGRFTNDVPQFAGRIVFDCDQDVVKLLDDLGMLLGNSKFTHSYPHCWRSKNPVIFRATPQWFISVDNAFVPNDKPDAKPDSLRANALKAIEDVQFIPTWGRDRITGMLKSRPDWCISRQRHWGVPIVAVACQDCGNTFTSKELIDHVADIFELEGADAWFDRELKDLLPAGLKCPTCSSTNFDKSRDILDVWFDSGVSYAAVMEAEHGFKTKTDLYLEGSDQHRGWFQSSLLASVGTRGQAPYEAVLTHGFVVDGNGRKLSKSEGNYIDPNKIINANGADLLRLWTASEDYKDDIRLSQEILNRLIEAYRKIRNTFRFMLGVIPDFNPDTDMVPPEKLLLQDRWALVRFGELVDKIRSFYDTYDFHAAVRNMLDFLVLDMSAFFLHMSKDRLYCAVPTGIERRSAQTVIWQILDGCLRLMAPLLSFTVEEAWGHFGKKADAPDSVFLTSLPDASDYPTDPELMTTMAQFFEVRDIVLKALEESRAAKLIGHPLAAAVHLQLVADSEHQKAVMYFGKDLPELLAVSRVTLENVASLPPDTIAVAQVTPITDERCPRCWNHALTIGTDPNHPELCARCAEAIRSIENDP